MNESDGIRRDKEWLLGHEPIEKSINVRKEIARLAKDPLEHLVARLGSKDLSWIVDNEIQLYRHAYVEYFLTVARYLPEMSLAIRYDRGPRWVRGSGAKYTKQQADLARRYHAVAPYIEIDFLNCLLYARILLDKVISLSRYFLEGKNLPSFTSFHKHKTFFAKLTAPYGDHQEYADHIRSKTDWFDMPLKAVRDKFLVHPHPPYTRSLGFETERELSLVVMFPATEERTKWMSKVNIISVSIPRLTWQIEKFLEWFCDYGLRALKTRNPTKAVTR